MIGFYYVGYGLEDTQGMGWADVAHKDLEKVLNMGSWVFLVPVLAVRIR